MSRHAGALRRASARRLCPSARLRYVDGVKSGFVTSLRASVGTLRRRATDGLRRARTRWPWFDHVVRAYGRYNDRSGDRLAGAVTFFGFLSFFPLFAFAYGVIGVIGSHDQRLRGYLRHAVVSLLPGVGHQLDLQAIHPRSTGVVALVALLFTGIGWIDALRESLREIWLSPMDKGNFIMKKLAAVGVMAALGVALLASVAVSSLATSATRAMLHGLGLEHVVGAGVALRVLSVLVALLFDVVIFLVMFARLSGTSQPWRRLLPGSLLAAIGFEVLKLVGTYLVARTTHNPVYGTFAVEAGMLVWMNLAIRFTLFAAAWTATALRVPPPVPDMAPGMAGPPGAT